jgi:hypothetical protein
MEFQLNFTSIGPFSPTILAGFAPEPAGGTGTYEENTPIALKDTGENLLRDEKVKEAFLGG